MDDEVLSRIGRLNPVASCLDEALTELMHEQQSEATYDNHNSSQSQAESEASQEDKEKEVVVIDDEFRESILSKFGKATSHAFYDEERTTIKPPDDMHDPEPPAALLFGKIKYFNRFGGQWRIVVSDVEIRPRVDVDYSTLVKKRDLVSLGETSRRQMEKELKWKRRRINGDTGLLKMNDDGAVKIDGDLTILAFGDTV